MTNCSCWLAGTTFQYDDAIPVRSIWGPLALRKRPTPPGRHELTARSLRKPRLSATARWLRLAGSLATLLLRPPAPVLGQSIITVAGGGTTDGQKGTSTRLQDVWDLEIGPDGDLYFSDSELNAIRKISPATGLLTTVAGNGARGHSGDGGDALHASLNRPGRIALGVSRDLLIAEGAGGRVRRVDLKTGTIETFAGGGTAAAKDGVAASQARFQGVLAVTVAPNGDLYLIEGAPQATSVFFMGAKGPRIWKVSAAQRQLSLVAGVDSTGGYSGDGGPATLAKLAATSLALDTAGNLVIAEGTNNRIRRIDGATGVITTVAGTGTAGYTGDGGPATQAQLRGPVDFSFDPDGNIVIGDWSNNAVRRVAATTGTISTVAKTSPPAGVAVDHAGVLYLAGMQTIAVLAEPNATPRLLAGGGFAAIYPNLTPRPAVDATLFTPIGIAFDGRENLWIDEYSCCTFSVVRKVERTSGLISCVAGNCAADWKLGDGGPASKTLVYARGLAFDPAGNLLVADEGNSRVRRVDASSGTITTVAGDGTQGYGGDGGPATAAKLNHPLGVAVDASGNLFVADSANFRIRRVEASRGVITTVAGNGSRGPGGDGPATEVPLANLWGLVVDSRANVVFLENGSTVRKVDALTGRITTIASGLQANGIGLDGSDHVYVAAKTRILRIDAGSGSISTVLGSDVPGMTGDGGPASRALLSNASGVAVTSAGDVYYSDQSANRVRAVLGCRRSLGGFDAAYPPDGATGSGSGLRLGWSRADSAFRYDVLVDTEFPPSRAVERDVSGQAVQVSALAPGRTYFWQVRAKGDPNCPGVERLSTVRRITVPEVCSRPAPPVLASPQAPGPTTQLSFNGPPGAASYDVYLSSGSSPPALAAAGLSATSYTAAGLAPGTTYRWRVVAHAACDTALATSSFEAEFTVPGNCSAGPDPELLAPPDSAVGEPGSATLSWTRVLGAGSYDVFLGPGSADPPLFASGVTSTSLSVSLPPSTGYRWRVVAHAACGHGQTSSSPFRVFRTAACAAPGVPGSLSSSKGSAFKVTSYTLTWSPADGAGSSYRVERSRSADFSSPESFTTAETSLTLSATEAATYHHRVSSSASCGSSSGWTAALQVTVSAAPPHIEFVRPPRAVVISQPQPGSPLPRLELEVRNTGTSDFVGFFATSQTIPFFIPSETALSLRAGEIRIYYLQLSGVPTDVPGQYDGTLSLVSANPSDTTVHSQVPVSLVVTGVRPGDPIPSTTPPQLLSAGAPVESLRFSPAVTSELPPDLSVDVKNSGAAPLELAADVLPDPWVSLEPGWNAAPLAPGATRTVKLRCERIRGEAGGAFPRFTYVTFRTIDGKSSRLLVEDPGPLASSLLPGRAVLTGGDWSWIVPSIVNAGSRTGGRYVSRVLVTNLGTDPAQADLFYTPDTGDPATSGYDTGRVLFSSLVVPPNDVVALSDPVGLLFRTEGSGSLEIRSSRIGQLRVQSVVDAPALGGGSFGFQLPTVRSGDGARVNAPHSVVGVQQSATYRSNLILSETSGQSAEVTVTLYDRAGMPLRSAQLGLPPYAKRQVSVAELSGGTDLSAGSLEIQVSPGSPGSVAAVVTTIDGRTGDASSFLSKPVRAAKSATTFTIASVVSTSTFGSRVEIRNDDDRSVTYFLTYRGTTGTMTSLPRTLASRAMDVWDSVLPELFGLPPGTFGPLQVSADSPNLTVVSRVYSETGSGSYGDTIPGVALDDPTTTGASNLTVLVDGLEGTAGNDRSRGARTNLILTETAGKPVEIEVAIWEKSQRRLAPAGTLTVRLEPYEQRQINDLFGAEGFGIGHKDRLNVLCTVMPRGLSQGRVVALATRIDNVTNDTKNLMMRP